MEKRELSGRIAVVTGAGRRRGIGTAICRALADKGADIFIYDRKHTTVLDFPGINTEADEVQAFPTVFNRYLVFASKAAGIGADSRANGIESTSR